MHQRSMIIFVVMMLLLAACQGPPPTQIILVVTATPDEPQADETAEVQAVPTTEEDPTATPVPSTPTRPPTATPDGFPGITVNQIQVAEQVFENGRMFWIGPTQQIWVMIITDEGQGEWRIFEDTFVEGDLEFDPDIVPPEGLEQPQRGFGKLWRENPDLRDVLGWAVTPEFGFVTNYEYHPGGSINASNEWVEGPGYHIVSSLYEESFRFNEADQTWQIK